MKRLDATGVRSDAQTGKASLETIHRDLRPLPLCRMTPPVSVRNTYTCRICGRKEVTEYGVGFGEPLLTNAEPDGWRTVGFLLICDRHKVTLKVDDCKEFDL